ncbi:hypothetical protein INR49_010896 [Caranx melampygus]|nr:hypothetical protein INR49_010896 [Caranx melampygus]
MARCIENNTIEIIPYECPPLENITCTNGKKPVLVYDELTCCYHYACDCVCEGWGDPHYITFDGLFYSYQGNCSYILMEEISPRFHLKIYIDNVFCDPTEDVSCPRSITVSYHTQVITLINHNLIGAVKLEALKNGQHLKLPYSQYGIKIMDSGINLVLEISHLNVVVTFGISGFSVNLPFQYFGKNTQGHCGTCNNNRADDCMLPGGQLVENCAVMADYWLRKDIDQPNCEIPSVQPTNSPKPPPTSSACPPNAICDLLNSSVFAACHDFVSPEHFYKGCIFDSCHVSNSAVECISLQTYAAACAQAGVCIHWRNHTTHCASVCPSDKVYKPCGPAEQPTCEDNTSEPTMNFTTEGCFCPEGMKLFNKESGVCVDKCGCLDPEGIPREFNETFEYKCQDCICLESTKTVTCKPRMCPPAPVADCVEPGFVLVNHTNPLDPCCPAYVCQPKRVCVHKGSEYQGYDYVESDPDACCGKCVQTKCVFNVNGTNQLLGEGKIWSPPKNKCERYTCIKIAESLTTVRSQIVCPPFDQSNCHPDTIQTAADGCCTTCVEKEKACKLVPMKTRVQDNGCASYEEVDMPYCEGSCNTFTKWSEAAVGLMNSCSCCKEKRFSRRSVNLHCLNGEVVTFYYVYVEECGCGPTYCKPAGQPSRRRRSLP